MTGYFIGTWVIYIATMGSMSPLDGSPSFESQDECQAFLIKAIEDKKFDQLDDGDIPICWPEPANRWALLDSK